MMTLKISQSAYLKVVLHAVKHKRAAVNSFLVGRSFPNGDVRVEITDSIPLFHKNLGLLPPLEISFTMIEKHLHDEDLGIVGYFHANEILNDVKLCDLAKNVGDKIYERFPHAFILLLDNDKFEKLLNEEEDIGPIMQLFVKDGLKWKPSGSAADAKLVVDGGATNAALLDHMRSGKLPDIVDVDDHLDDPSKDWLNKGLFD